MLKSEECFQAGQAYLGKILRVQGVKNVISYMCKLLETAATRWSEN